MHNWKSIKLSDMSNSCLGKMLDKKKNIGELYPYLGNKNVRWGSFNLDNLNMMRFEEREFERYSIKPGDLIVCEGGEPGRCAIWKGQVAEMRIQKALHRVRVKEGFDPYFLYYRFLLGGRNNELSKHFIGSTIKHLTGVILKNMQFRFPNYHIQTKISSVLSKIDSKIELNNKTNTKLEAMAKLIYDYWFVQFDFPDVNGKPYKSSGGKMVYDEELKREIPEGWRVEKLGKVVKIFRGASPRPIRDFLSSEGIPWVKISDATKTSNRFICKTKQYIIKEGKSKSRSVKPDTLIVSNSATPGIPRIMKINACVHDGWLIIDDYTNGLSPEFMYHFFKHERLRLISLGTGSIFKNLKTDYLKEFKIILPPQDIIDKVAPILKTNSEAIYKRTAENQHLKNMRDFLLPMLMNGQVTVKE